MFNMRESFNRFSPLCTQITLLYIIIIIVIFIALFTLASHFITWGGVEGDGEEVPGCTSSIHFWACWAGNWDPKRGA